MPNSLFGPLDPAPDAGWVDAPERKGFLTDTSVCIGCKACEVACKEWNRVPEDGLSLLGSSFDNSRSLGASTWRHVKFIEQPGRADDAVLSRQPVDLGMPGLRPQDAPTAGDAPQAADAPAPEAVQPDFRWLMSSDVCKHCTHAGCLDVCPTGALFRTEFGTVVVQDDVCNGCGYCVAGCPFGVIERREGDKGTVTNAGIAQKCTLCYDRLKADQTPACAKACPTESIQFGDVAELRERGKARVAQLHEQGYTSARMYGDDPHDGVGGTGAMFLLLDEPEVYGLPPDPVVTTRDLADIFRKGGVGGLTLLVGVALSFLGGRR
ncbi:4Fe-4S dicluster domain-containing protein [Arsenicicoccus dermatophilus]|uniref:4Fe-4S dicluster domain-containing protein n=1 Tax=Arsenicicoccus dermatophilus TaxID=1076331 RepID=UPI001F4D31AF|nr:4Fe-4S dicluster domain-containing protein [Arsenicicoccus dermatophilus]MCH8612971.1 4Fe-4S dicluster domain-containing protein [Arsenicicoccus dermatophilus]